MEILKLKNIWNFKKSLDALNTRGEVAGGTVYGFEDRSIVIVQSEEQRGKNTYKGDQSLVELWDNIKQ